MRKPMRRIREAEETGAVELDLSGMKEGEAGWAYTGLETCWPSSPCSDRSTSPGAGL
jgi:hypothetical protein